jgi:hypothetical protein
MVTTQHVSAWDIEIAETSITTFCQALAEQGYVIIKQTEIDKNE